MRDQVLLVAAFVEVGDEDHDRLLRLADEFVRVNHRLRDVGAAAELHLQQDVHRLTDLIGKVNHVRVEQHERRLHRRQFGEDGRHHRREDGALEHRAGLVHHDDDVPRLLLPLRGVEVDAVHEELAALLVEVPEVAAERRLEIEVSEHLPRRVPVLPDRAGNRLLHLNLHLALQLFDHLLDDLARVPASSR